METVQPTLMFICKSDYNLEEKKTHVEKRGPCIGQCFLSVLNLI